MKVAFIVLLLAVAVLAKRSHKAPVSSHADFEPDCKVGEDCEKLCNLQCFYSVDALCVDGSCLCDVEPVVSKHRQLMTSKRHQ